MTNAEQKKLEALQDGYASKIAALANKRMARLAKSFYTKFPTHSLKIGFGMGTEYATIDGKDFELDGNFDAPHQITERRMVKMIAEAIADVDTITDGHRIAAPDNVEVMSREERAAFLKAGGCPAEYLEEAMKESR